MPAPTLNDAITNRTPGNYYEFIGNHTVIHRFFLNGVQVTNYWFHDRPEMCMMCDGIDWTAPYTPPRSDFCCGACATAYDETPISCRICGGDCRGCDYEKWGFCTRSCMVEATRDY
jgi:hypothetical protein